jgi:hypothetical protein
MAEVKKLRLSKNTVKTLKIASGVQAGANTYALQSCVQLGTYLNGGCYGS